MGISLNSARLQLYKELGLLLLKYGQRDLIEHSEWANSFSITCDQLERTDSAANPITAPKAEELSADIEKLGPTFIRIGQLMSGRPDLLPLPILDSLAHVGANIEPMPFLKVEEVIEADLRMRTAKLFQNFDPIPTSISPFGQTHAATVRGGKRVMVKVQRPNIQESVEADLEVLEQLARFYDEHTKSGKRYDLSAVLVEFRKIIVSELDYRMESHNLKTLKDNLKQLQSIVVPSPIDEYCSTHVLTTEFVDGNKIIDMRPSGLLASERTSLAGQIFYAYLQQFLMDGFVHADPDPGNIILTKTGKAALLDLGVVARLSAPVQEKLLQLLAEINEGRADRAADLVVAMGEKRDGFDENNFRHAVAQDVLVYRDTTGVHNEMGTVFQGIAQASAKYALALPAELTVFGQALLKLERVIHTLDPRFDAHDFLKRNLAEMMKGRIMTALSPSQLFHNLLETVDFLEKFPGQVSKILGALANNELSVTVHAIDEAVLISGFQKIANRIAAGVIVAALIMGAALLMHVRTEFTIWGYPGFAMLLFIAAAGCGFTLVIEVLWSDYGHRRGS